MASLAGSSFTVPFRNYYAKAKQMEGMTGENLMIILESRLDNVVFRLGLARTRKEARQIVDHKHVLVNGKQVNIPSYLVKAGDTIEIKENKKGSQRYKEILEATAGNMVPDLRSQYRNQPGYQHRLQHLLLRIRYKLSLLHQTQKCS